eukprot:2864537-Prymnesium_polylepis.1
MLPPADGEGGAGAGTHGGAGTGGGAGMSWARLAAGGAKAGSVGAPRAEGRAKSAGRERLPPQEPVERGGAAAGAKQQRAAATARPRAGEGGTAAAAGGA